MSTQPKIPPVYKPTPLRIAAPPVYRPQQTIHPSVQPKPAVNLRIETRPSPPVYRPQLSSNPRIQLKPNDHFKTKARPAPPVFRPAGLNGCGVQRAVVSQGIAGQLSHANSCHLATTIQRMESSGGGSFEDFLEQAWLVIKEHWESVEETDPEAEGSTRKESTVATFSREGFGPETGKNTDSHAEWTPVARFYVSFPSDFPQIVRGGTLECAGGKPSCFLCAAIAHTLGIKIQKKDRRGYGGHYALPAFMAEDHILIKFIGVAAYKTYVAAGKPETWLRQLPNGLYQKHSAKKSFVI